MQLDSFETIFVNDSAFKVFEGYETTLLLFPLPPLSLMILSSFVFTIFPMNSFLVDVSSSYLVQSVGSADDLYFLRKVKDFREQLFISKDQERKVALRSCLLPSLLSHAILLLSPSCFALSLNN